MANSSTASPAPYASTSTPIINGPLEFCNQPFWDTNLTWWAPVPDITPCFQFMIVRLIPSMWFWLLFPFKLCHYSSDERNRKKKGRDAVYFSYSPLTIAKMVLCGLLMLESIGEIIESGVLDSQQVTYRAISNFLSPAIEILTIAFVMIVINIDRRRGYVATGVLWMYWLLELIFYIAVDYSAILNWVRQSQSSGSTTVSNVNATLNNANATVSNGTSTSTVAWPLASEMWNNDTFVLVLVLVRLGLVIISFGLSNLSDREGDPSILMSDPILSEFGGNTAVEIPAGFSSRLVYSWMLPFVQRGSKKALEPVDLCSLNPIDRSDFNTPRFEKVHYAAVNAWRAQQREKKKAAKTNNTTYANEAYKVEETDVKVNNKMSAMGRRRGKKPDADEEHKKSDFENDKTKYPSATKSLMKVYWKDLMHSYLYKLLYDVLLFANVGLVALLIMFVSSPTRYEYVWQGVFYSILLAIIQVVQSISLQSTYFIGLRTGAHIRTALTSALYRKALTISNAARSKATLGQLVNLMAVDAQRVMDFMGFSWAFWSCPVQMIIAIVLIWYQMGPATLAGLATLVLFLMPISGIAGSIQRKLQIVQMRFKDERIKMITELLAGIRVVKLYAWESPFRTRIDTIRDREVNVLRKGAYLGIGHDFVFNFAPFLMTIVTFAVFIASDDVPMTPQRAFITLSLLQVLRIPIGILPIMTQYAITAIVAVKRISRFLAQPELNEANVSRVPNEAEPITMDGVAFGWTPRNEDNPDEEDVEPEEVLRDVNLHVKRGELLAVVGRVGSGKSTLISSMLGETELYSGRVNVSGTVAYVSQQSWIQNAPLRDNVLFGLPYDEARYKRIVAACALEQDLAMLPGGDKTEIGEKGINLSGGQKQRVAMARALYADADTYLFDDPLSAVDVHVGKHIFDQVVGPNGCLAGKTRVFVTHGLHWLPLCDRVAVIDPSAKQIVQLGPYDRLIAEPNSFLLNHLHLESEKEAKAEEAAERNSTASSDAGIHSQADSIVTTPAEKSDEGAAEKKPNAEDAEEIRAAIARQFKEKEAEQKLIQAETSATGRVKFKVYMSYFKAQPLLLFGCYALMQGISFALFVVADWWIALWTQDPRQYQGCLPSTSTGTITTSAPNFTATMATTTPPVCYTESEIADVNHYYMSVYGAIGAIAALVIVVASFLIATGTTRATRVLHSKMLERILHVPMHFFDTTPTGRIVNRFSKDVEMIDNLLPLTFRGWMQTSYRVITSIVAVCVGTPLVLVVVVPAAIAFYFVQRFFIPTSRQLKRLESTSKSPVITFFSESLQGCATIRAFGARDRFMAENERRIDYNSVFSILGIVATRWVGVLLDMISAVFVVAAAIFCVVSSIAFTTTGGQVGLSLSYALGISQTLNWMMHMNSEVETNIVSVERLKEYADLPEEPTWERSEADLANDGVQLSSQWPTQGEIELDTYSTRYRENLELVLKEVSMKVRPAEKIGIVGRTGAGKSSFTLALFRMIEAAGGRIVVDGIDIARLGVHQLRSKLTILPQDPIIFAGSLRSNLDPFNKSTDEDVWCALEQAGLKSHFVNGAGLMFECQEGGSNLSVGQRQLVCLARALLRKTKVLILDEATAAVDLRTDEFIQKTIRTAFSDCTVLTIAHRINTVMDYDRILVLDRGTVKEFDSPAALIARPDSVFSSMVQQHKASH